MITLVSQKVSIHNTRVEFVKFLVVGCANFLISFGVFYLLYEHWRVGSIVLDKLGYFGEDVNHLLLAWGVVSVDGTVAQIGGYLSGAVNSFFWNWAWTFRSDAQMTKQFPRFLLLNVLCLLFSTMSIFIFVDALNFPYKIIWVSTMSFVVVANFVGNKWWVFRVQPFRGASPRANNDGLRHTNLSE